MVVTAYQTRPAPVGFTGFRYEILSGLMAYAFTDAEIEIDVYADIYADFTSTLTPGVPAWVYGYGWNAIIQSPDEELSAYKLFASVPPRYDLGHICVSEKFGVFESYPLTFLQQKTPNYRAHFFEGNSDPGSIIPDFVPPLDAFFYTYANVNNIGFNLFNANGRANRLGIFKKRSSTTAVAISYYCGRVFDASDIANNSPLASVGIFP